MTNIVLIFAYVVQFIACVASLMAIVVFGVQRDTGMDAELFVRQNTLYKIAIFCLFWLGWIVGAPTQMVDFGSAFRVMGIIWFIFGAAFLAFLTFGLFTRADRRILESIRRFGVGDFIYGIVMVFLCWLMFGV